MARENKYPRKNKIRKIVICTSASFYKDALKIEKELKKLGLKVAAPLTAKVMEKAGNFDISFYKTWFKNPKDYNRKAFLMRNHFNKVVKADAMLVVNLEKNGVEGYIGGNTLMEMAIGFYLRKPIFILNKISGGCLFYEEILGMKPIFLHSDLTKIRVPAKRKKS